MLNSNPINTVFIDIITCFAVSIVLIANFVPVGNSMPAREDYPIVNIFLYKDNTARGYYVVMNGFEVSFSEMKRKIISYRKEIKVVKGKKLKTFFAVQVIASIDRRIPSGDTIDVFQAVMSLNSRKPGLEFLVTWKEQKLSNSEKKEAENAQRKNSTN